MIDRFEILNSESSRPDVERIIFCDGSGGRLFRPETDLELSHWRPNQTPSQYRAGTSTESCYRFLDEPTQGHWTVAVNTHVDVDGILSVYALVHSLLLTVKFTMERFSMVRTEQDISPTCFPMMSHTVKI